VGRFLRHGVHACVPAHVSKLLRTHCNWTESYCECDFFTLDAYAFWWWWQFVKSWYSKTIQSILLKLVLRIKRGWKDICFW